MKISLKSIGLALCVILTLFFFNAWRTEKAINTHMIQRMAEVHVLDAKTRNIITNISVHAYELPTDFRTEQQQNLLIWPERGAFVLAQIGSESLRATIKAPGYQTKEINLGSLGFKSDPVIVLLENEPQQGN